MSINNNMKNFITLLLLTSFFFSCQNDNPQLEKELKETKARLEAAKAALLKKENTTSTPLVHEVYFNLKDDLSENQINALESDILKLKDISVVHHLVLGTFKNLEDPRALSDYEIKMTMEFKNEKEYAEYQAHPIHLNLKKSVADLLAGPPATYDYLKK